MCAAPSDFPNVPLPRRWPRTAKAAVVHAAALAHLIVTHVRGWCANSPIARVRLTDENQRLMVKLACLKEELRIKDARMATIPAQKRPHYLPSERLAILELKAQNAWSQAQTAARFLVTDATVATWTCRLNELGPDALVRIPTPVNRFPDFVRHIVARLKTTCPQLGQIRIANLLARAGLLLGATTVRRFLRRKTPSSPATMPPTNRTADLAKSKRIVKSSAPNHTWNVDLSIVPTAGGFWVPWVPWVIAQRWPFCWWAAVVLDHFSRKVIVASVWRKQPTAVEVGALLDGAVRKAGHAPKYIISDQGTQFREEHLDWCSWHEVQPRFGAIGRYGSIAILERFFRSMKQEYFRRILVPFNRDTMVSELDSYVTWYNEYRPHMGLAGATPDEIYRAVQPARDGPRFETRRKVPANGRKLRARKGTCLELIVTNLNGKAQLPIVELRTA